MAAHKHAELLQAVADEAKVNAKYWEAFEGQAFGIWRQCQRESDIFVLWPNIRRVEVIASAEVE